MSHEEGREGFERRLARGEGVVSQYEGTGLRTGRSCGGALCGGGDGDGGGDCGESDMTTRWSTIIFRKLEVAVW